MLFDLSVWQFSGFPARSGGSVIADESIESQSIIILWNDLILLPIGATAESLCLHAMFEARSKTWVFSPSHGLEGH